MKRILFALLALLCVCSCSLTAFAEEVAEGEVELTWNPMNFVDNLDIMGLGMLGIFVVIGVVILITLLLNTVTSKKK